MRCIQHTGNSNHAEGTKPHEAIDYLFDMLVKPGGQEKRGEKDTHKKKQSPFDESGINFDYLCFGVQENQTWKSRLLCDYYNFCLL